MYYFLSVENTSIHSFTEPYKALFKFVDHFHEYEILFWYLVFFLKVSQHDNSCRMNFPDHTPEIRKRAL